MRLHCCVIALIALVLVPQQSFGQEPAASLHGRVVDTAGRGIAGVTVTAQSANLAGLLTTRTTASGSYGFAALPPGAYVISFSRDGLVTVKQTMRLSAAEAAQVRVVMFPVNGTDRAITVTAERQVFPPSWATSLASKHTSLELLPVTGTTRSVTGFVTAAPGARPDASLFLIDGLPLRSQWNAGPLASFAGPGPETLREVTVSPGRLPAGYGRLQAGAIEAVTVRGANSLAGSVRATFDGADLNSDLMRAARATDGFSGTAEYTLGGSLIRDRIWFFGSGRHLSQSVEDFTAFAGTPFTTKTRERLGLGKVTLALNERHRFEAQWMGVEQRRTNAAPVNARLVGDTNALDSQTMSDAAVSGAYIARISRKLDLAVRFTHEEGRTRLADPGRSTDLQLNTQLVDQQTGIAWWAPGTCTVCERASTNETLRATIGTALGSHYFTLGYDAASHSFAPAAANAGGNFQIRATRTALVDGVVMPVIAPGSTWIVWFPDVDQRLRLKSEAVFISDRWLAGDRLTIDFGIRADRHRGTLRSDDRTILSELGVSPRLLASWRPSERRPWVIDAGFGRYAIDPFDRGLDASLWDQPVTRGFAYGGPAINSTAATIGSSEAISRVFTWFSANGSTSRAPSFAVDPRLLPEASTTKPPSVDEWSFGISRQIGQSGHARIDFTRRTYANVPGRVVDAGSADVDSLGKAIDSARIVASDLLERDYTGFTLKAKYRFGHYADVDSQYTFSRLTGNADDRLLAGNVFARAALGYPEFFQTDWFLPSGALPDDARHRFRMWAHTEVMAHDKHGLLIVTLVHSRESGRPFGAVGLVGVQASGTNPGYLQPPAAIPYFFTERDAFRTERLARWDIGVNYRRRLPGTIHGDLIAAFQILNVTNQSVVFHPERFVFVRTAFTDPTLQPFNPFTQTPVQGTHWTLDDANTNTDTARAGVPMTMGRTFRFVLGIRF